MSRHPLINPMVSAILLLDKPAYWSSNGVLQQVKKRLSIKKAGHGGTLDPLATGMLPILLGEATKFSQFLINGDKRYEVCAHFGWQSSTGDCEGFLQSMPMPTLKAPDILTCFQHFLGESWQTPPMFSAVKHQGQPLYQLARRGLVVPRAPRQIELRDFDLIAQQGALVSFAVTCSKGTYIRTLVEDMGKFLGGSGYVKRLRRLWVSPFQQQKMVTLEALPHGKVTDASTSGLYPVESALTLPVLHLSVEDCRRLQQGQTIQMPSAKDADIMSLFTVHGQFFGIGRIIDNWQVKPQRLLENVKIMT